MACKPIVAPLVGAWIEIGFRLYLSCSIGVAPLVGAWIEMMLSPKRFPEPVVAPLVGAWIEISKGMSASEWIKSLPSWERGLKYQIHINASVQLRSLPSWERGLKSRGSNRGLTCLRVAPLVGAWIEISDVRLRTPASGSRSPRGSVDWNISVFIRTASNLLSLPSRERGLKCTDDGDNLFFQHGRSPCGSDHWNRKDNRISCTMWLHRRRISNWVRRLGKVIGQRKRIWKPYFGETEWHRKNTRWKTDIWVKIFISKKMETICHFGCKKRTWKHN